MIPRSTPRPGKTQALLSDSADKAEIFDLRQLYAYGKSVNRGWRMGPTVLLIKDKIEPNGERTQCLSVKALITDATFTALLLMAVASTMLTIPMVAPMLARRAAETGADADVGRA